MSLALQKPFPLAAKITERTPVSVDLRDSTFVTSPATSSSLGSVGKSSLYLDGSLTIALRWVDLGKLLDHFGWCIGCQTIQSGGDGDGDGTQTLRLFLGLARYSHTPCRFFHQRQALQLLTSGGFWSNQIYFQVTSEGSKLLQTDLCYTEYRNKYQNDTQKRHV